jgi:DNA-binding response OmpR family regulator
LIVLDEHCLEGSTDGDKDKLDSLPHNGHVPIAMILAGPGEQGKQRGLELGAKECAVPPFAPEAFASRMRELAKSSNCELAPELGVHHVLVVDEDVDQLCVMGTALHMRGGFEVALADGCEDARVRMQEIQVGALIAPLSELDRPQEDEFCLGNTGICTNEHAVIVTIEEGDESDVEALLSAGVKGVIRKPFDLATLAGEVERILGVPTRRPCDCGRFVKEVQRVSERRRQTLAPARKKEPRKERRRPSDGWIG